MRTTYHVLHLLHALRSRANLVRLQARVFLRTLKGEVVLPSRDEMLADTEREMERRRAMGMKNRQAHMMGPMQVSSQSKSNWSVVSSIANSVVLKI